MQEVNWMDSQCLINGEKTKERTDRALVTFSGNAYLTINGHDNGVLLRGQLRYWTFPIIGLRIPASFILNVVILRLGLVYSSMTLVGLIPPQGLRIFHSRVSQLHLPEEMFLQSGCDERISWPQTAR